MFKRRLTPLFLEEGDTGANGGATVTVTTPPPAPAASTTPPAQPVPVAAPAAPTADQIDVVHARLLKKVGDDVAKLSRGLTKQNIVLAGDVKYKDAQLEQANATIADLRGQLQKAAVPAGSVVVTKADADELAAYRKLGKPSDLDTTVKELGTVKETLAQRDRRQELDRVARVMGYDPDVLADQAGGMAFKKKTVKRRGEDVETFEVTDKGEDGKERTRPIEEVEQAEWKRYLPSLKAGGDEPTDPRGRQAPRPNAARPTGGAAPYRSSAEHRGSTRDSDAPTVDEKNRRAAFASGVNVI